MRNIKSRVCLLFAALLVFSMLPRSIVSAESFSAYAGGRRGDGAGIYAYGVDLSEWQGGAVDFPSIAADGYSFVILRAGFSQTEDEFFEENYVRAKDAGLNVGVYLYSYADSVEEVLRESAALKSWLNGKTLEYPVYFDLEDPQTHEPLSTEHLSDLAMTFLDDMAADGWLSGLYSCKSWLDGKINTEQVCERYECWMALYLSSGTYDMFDRYDTFCGMWQYSSTGRVAGVPGAVDMNVAFKDYPSICREYGFNGYEASGETLTLKGASSANVMACGDTYPVIGRVSTTAEMLTDVTVGFYDRDGKMIVGHSVEPKRDCYNLAKLTDEIKSKELPEGAYYYCVYATDTKQSKCLLRQHVAVSSCGVRLDGAKVPQNLKQSDDFIPGGILTASTEIEQITVYVMDEEKQIVSSISKQPLKKAFNLAKLGNSLNTDSLSIGEYIYCMDVTTAKGSERLILSPFTVWVRDDPVAFSGTLMNKEHYAEGKVVLGGKLMSKNSAFTAVYVRIRDSFGRVVCSAELTNCGNELALARLNPKFATTRLTADTYTCEVYAVNAGGPTLAAKQSFCIRTDGVSANDVQMPTLLHCGEGYALRGFVTSERTALRRVSVTVIDMDGVAVMDVSVVPNGQRFNLSALARRLHFSELKKGSYTLQISAENGNASAVVFKTTFIMA